MLNQDNKQNNNFDANIVEEEDTKVVWFSLVVFLVALVVIAFFIFKYSERYNQREGILDSKQTQDDEDYLNISKRLPIEMEGKIYLTLAPKDDENNTVGIYVYDLKKERLAELLVNEGEQLIGGETVHFTIGDYISVTDGDSLFVNGIEDLALNSWGTLLVDGIKNFKRAPVWTDGGWFAIYNARDDVSLDPNAPDNWQIYLSQTDAAKPEGKYLAGGIHPHVNKEDNIIFLKNDGLYSIEMDGENKIKVWDIEGEARTNMQLDVSKISDLVVLSNPNQESLVIIRIKIKGEKYYYEGEFVKELKAYAFQPALSPDDKYLAVIELEEIEASLINPKLVVYNLETYERKEIMDLKNYKPEQMLISDWR